LKEKDQQRIMKNATRFLIILLLTLGGLATRAKADSTPTTFSISGTYDSGTPSYPLSQAGQDFTMTFTVPSQPASLVQSYEMGDDFYLYPMNVTYSMDGVQTILSNSLVAFYTVGAASQSGGFFVAWCATDVECMTGLEYQWTFAGPQQYSGPENNPTMQPSGFTYDNQPFTVYDNTLGGTDPSIYGSVSLAAMTPEPSSIAMLLLGAVFALFLLRKTQLSV
jgi:hypothetical protein